jgi:hypothetical protein
MSWAKDTAFDLWHLSHPPNQQKREKKIPKWRRPEEGWSKVNTDAAFSEDSKKGATTSVIRDDQGALQAAEALWYEQGLDAYTMEALACRDGLKLAVQLGLRRVQLESDCLQAVQLWKRKNMQRSSHSKGDGGNKSCLSRIFSLIIVEIVIRLCTA